MVVSYSSLVVFVLASAFPVREMQGAQSGWLFGAVYLEGVLPGYTQKRNYGHLLVVLFSQFEALEFQSS